jgi:nitrogen fixation protein NifU and related proteins
VSDVDELYQAVIVDHDRAPRNHGPLAGATHEATADNPLCGDEVTVQLRVDGGVIRAVAFVGHGCALSRAAASIMTEQLRDRDEAAVRALAADFAAFVRAPPSDPVDAARFGDLAAFAGVRRFRAALGALGHRG